VDVVFGHLGYVPASKSPAEPGFQALLRLMRDGKAWVKLTAPYRLTMSAMPYGDTDAFAHALVDAAPQRLVWGTDWPHVFIKTAMPEDRQLVALFEHWVPDAAMRRRNLVEQPAELYRFIRP
jgi:predicted TIM-barrel fold metal-dependent hydrolase